MDLSFIQPLLDWMVINPELSGLIVFLVAAGESLALVGILVPGVVLMLGIGALVGLGAMDLWDTLFWAALGAIVGDWISYWLGRHFDQQLRHLWPLSKYPKLIPAGEKFFTRHGGKSVLFGRFVGPLRPVIPAVAGIMHMPQAKFYFMNVLSAVLWAPVVILPGVAFGESMQLAHAVFGKLIALIVLAILLAAALGFLGKKLVAYVLMISVNTWGEFFGFYSENDKTKYIARENLLSFSLTGILVLTLAIFVVQYEHQYLPIANKQEISSYQWWQKNWQKFAITQVKNYGEYPINLQWWGSLNDVDSNMQQLGWVHAEKLALKNSFNYFLPEPNITQLPLIASNLFSENEALIMIKQGDDSKHFSIIRFWTANASNIDQEQQLWLGVIYQVNLYSLFNLVQIPVPNDCYSEPIQELKAELQSVARSLVVQQKRYSNVGVTDCWRGELLIIEFEKDLGEGPLVR